MMYTSIDKVVKGYLLQRKFPIHFYIDFLIYCTRCFEEINFDSIGNVRTLKLPRNSYGAVTLPPDYQDWVKIGVENGQFVKPLIQRNGMNNLNNYEPILGSDIFTPPFDDTFESAGKSIFDQTFDSTFQTENKIMFPENMYGSMWPQSFWRGYTVRWNDHLEFTGRYFGARVDRSDSFKVIPERNEIQLHNNIQANDIVLEYISDGSAIDNATQINPYAKATLEAYINWKYKENNRSYSEGERVRAQRQFDHQHRILRGRMNDMTMSDLRAIIYRNTSGAPK